MHRTRGTRERALHNEFETANARFATARYHMFQFVVVANNGMYGGSNAYTPFKEAHLKQVFHLHG
jgi:hypothetical protein